MSSRRAHTSREISTSTEPRATRAGGQPHNPRRRRLVGASAVLLAVPTLLSVVRDVSAQEICEETGLPRTSLDGLSFRGPTGAVGMKEHHHEVLAFSDGLLSSSECEKWGFLPARYKAWKQGSTVHFRARLHSDEYGEISWEGEIRNQVVTAHYHWRKERLFWTLKNSYWFTGEKQSGELG